MNVRRIASFIPLAPVAALCAGVGAAAVLIDLYGRVDRFWVGVWEDVERNTRRWAP